MTTIPHAVDRDVVGRTVALQQAARDAGPDGVLLRHRVQTRLS